MSFYRKKPVVIEAKQLPPTGTQLNRSRLTLTEDLASWCGGNVSEDGYSVVIKTLEGDMLASKGDYIIKGVNGEFYPCKPDIFDKTYEPA